MSEVTGSPKWSRRKFSTACIGFGIGAAAPSYGQLRQDLDLLPRGSDAFASSCGIFNTDVHLQPKIIAKCRSVDAVSKAIHYANERGLPVAVRSGGHSFVGHCLNDNGVLIDLTEMNRHSLLPDGVGFVADPAVKLGGVYESLLPRRRLLPAGSCAGVGLAGLTLGGGYGLFARQYGLTCDHLEGVTFVSGSGEVIDSEDDADLLWAARGGGNGNFGVAVSFRFRTRPAPEFIAAERFVASLSGVSETVSLMRRWFEIATVLPDPIFAALVLNHKGASVLMTSTYAETGPAFSRASAQFRAAGMKSKGSSRVEPMRSVKRYYGRTEPLPFRNFSGGFYQGMADIEGAAEGIVSELRSESGLIFQINTLGSQIANGPDSAYAHRAYPFLGEVQAYWEPGQSEKRERLVAATDRIRLGLQQSGVSRHYRNYPSLDFSDWENAYYGSRYSKLQQLKKKYDPSNLFRGSQRVGAAG